MGHCGRYSTGKAGEGGKREGGGTATGEGGGKEGGGKSRGIALPRAGTSRKKPRRERSDTKTEAAGREAGT